MPDATAVLVLSGPLQSWGTSASWETRPTLRRPTKSGVLGMVANALGRDFSDDPSDLAALRFSVRADRPGHLITDDQTAGSGNFPLLLADYADNPELASSPERSIYGAPRAPRQRPDGTLAAPWTRVSRGGVLIKKTYIADAAFLVGLAGSSVVVRAVAHALENPRRLLFLGRRCCPLGTPPLHHIATRPGWQNTTPLLPNATDTTPQFWYETPPESGSVGSPEQPRPSPDRRHHTTMIHLQTSRITPPAQAGHRTSTNL